MEFFKIVETWSINKFPSVDKEDIGLIIAIFFLAGYGLNFFIKYINFNSFDLKLLHKKNQNIIPFLRNTFLISILTTLYFILNLCIALIIIKIPPLEIIFSFIMLLFLMIIFIGFILLLILLIIDGTIFIYKKINGNSNARLTISSFEKYIKTKYPNIYFNTLVVLSMLFVSTEIVMINSNIKKNENILDVIQPSDSFFIFLFCIIPPIIFYLQNQHTLRNNQYQLIDISKNLPKYNLYLDYYINDNTSLLTSEDNIYRVIKKLEGEIQIYEVYKKIEGKDNEIEKHKTNAIETTVHHAPVSAADEILKFKQLLDAEVLTQEEFDGKKKELLGL